MINIPSFFRYDPTSPTFLVHAFDKNSRIREGMPAGSIKKDGHVAVAVSAATYQASRIVWALHHNNKLPPDDICICTRNGDLGDLRIENLIPLSLSQRRHYLNMIRGKACIELRGNRWHARIETPTDRRFIGTYSNKPDAIAAHRKAAMEIILGFEW